MIHGLVVHSPKYLVLPRVSEPLLGILMFMGSLITVWRLKRRARFDVISSMWLYPDSVAAGWIGKFLRIPTVPTALGCDVNRMLKEGDKRGQILSMLHASAIITTVSEPLSEGLVSWGIPASRISTIPNGVNGSLFFARDKQKARAEIGLPSKQKIVLYVGRLSEEKGISTLIDAVGKLRKRGKNFLTCIVGDGPLKSELQARVDAQGLTEHVHFAGAQDHNTIAIWFGACDIFCLPSLREGCPNVVIEALSSGRPVVASRVGGIPEMLRAETGILVEPQNVEGFADAISTALFAHAWNEAVIAQSISGVTWRAAAEAYNRAYRVAVSAV